MKNDTPAEWLITHHKREIKATNQHNRAFVLSASMAEIDKDGELRIDTITSTFVLKVDIHDSFTVINPMQALAEVGAFFSFLHEPIAKASVSQQKHMSVLRPREFLELRCKHQRLIDRAMHALSTGEYEFNAELYLQKDNQDHQRFYLSAIVASEVLLRNLRKQPGHLQLMMTELLRSKSTQEFHDWLSRAGIAASRKYDWSSRISDSIKAMREEVKPGPRDFAMRYYDNAGWQKIGQHAGYDQWVIVDVVVVPEETLKAAGFYKDDEDPDARISRDPDVVWEDATQNLTNYEKNCLLYLNLYTTTQDITLHND
jgi:hypothetical protein